MNPSHQIKAPKPDDPNSHFSRAEVEWIGQEATRILEFHLANIALHARGYQSAHSLIVAAIFASFALAMAWLSKPETFAMAIGMAAGCVYLVSLALYLAKAAPGPLTGPGNWPRNLIKAVEKRHQESAGLRSVIHGHILSLEERINQAWTRDNQMAAALRRTRLLVILAPFISAAGGAIARFGFSL